MITAVLLILSLSLVRASLSVLEKRGEHATSARFWGELLEAGIVASAVIFLVVRPFVAQAYFIPSSSMRPTLREDDRILVDKLSYRFGLPSRRDVVVFRAPDSAVRAEGGTEETDFVKRVVGLPGDMVEVHHGTLYVNGKAQTEPYCGEPPLYDLPPYVVPPRKLFVMGDNRNHSNDSHRWGAVESSRLIGRAMWVFWPPSRAGRIE